jgi:hypothetical protein
MLKKHFIILFLLVTAVGVFGQSIPSGTARYESLGFNPFIMDAAVDINRNPAWSTMYRNYAFGDLGRFTPGEQQKGGEYFLQDQYAGVNFGLGKQWNMGAVLNKEEGQIFGSQDLGSDFQSRYNGLGIEAPIVPMELMVGYMSASKKLSVGIAPYYARWSHDFTGLNSDTTLVNRSSSIMGGTIGVVGKMKDGWWEANVDARLNKYKEENTVRVIGGKGDTSNVTTTFENDGGFEINANVRGFFMVSKPNKVNLVPYITFGMFNWTPKVTTTPATTFTEEYKWMTIKGGVGINMPILDDGMLAGGVTSGITTIKYNAADVGATYEYKATHFYLPQFNVGGEWKFNDWLTGRIGYARAIIRSKVEESATGFTFTPHDEELSLASDPNHTITLGLGWQFGRFSVDGLIGERFFQQGPYILSGKDDDLYGILSASYNFNK